MLGQLSFGVAGLERSKIFHDRVLGALGYERVYTSANASGSGLPGTTVEMLLLIAQEDAVAPPGAGFHLAFSAPSHEAVIHFHAAALQLAVQAWGDPGPRAAYVRDPDGYKLEAKYPTTQMQ